MMPGLWPHSAWEYHRYSYTYIHRDILCVCVRILCRWCVCGTGPLGQTIHCARPHLAWTLDSRSAEAHITHLKTIGGHMMLHTDTPVTTVSCVLSLQMFLVFNMEDSSQLVSNSEDTVVFYSWVNTSVHTYHVYYTPFFLHLCSVI